MQTVARPSADSFFSPVPERPREDLLQTYERFLRTRNGERLPSGGFVERERWLAESRSWTARHAGELDARAFNSLYARFAPHDACTQAMIALLAFVKINAGEAYGVEVVRRARHDDPARHGWDLFHQLERTLADEEVYHTKILVGATQHFGVEATGAWQPAVQLRVLIRVLAHSPRGIFHPVLLGSEIAGVYAFNWMLQRVGTIFRDEPDLQECLERRLIEVLVDEVGHIAFNRMAVGPRGLDVARSLASLVARGTIQSTPEYGALGWNDETLRGVGGFDLCQLPAEVRRRAFFV